MSDELGSGEKLQAALLPAPCNNDCNQGRDCECGAVGGAACALAEFAGRLVAALAIISGLVYLAARIGWL